VYQIGSFGISISFFPILFASSVLARLKHVDRNKPTLVWGSTPIINNSYWSRAMVNAGFDSETYTGDFYSTINKRQDWDRILSEEFPYVWWPIKPYFAFLASLFRYDVFFMSFDGFFIGNTPLRAFQALLLNLAGKKIIVIPYGSDSYVYRNIRSAGTLHGLLMSYPAASMRQESKLRDVQYWVKHAHAVLPGFMGPDGFGRWDVLMPSTLMLDLQSWEVSKRNSSSRGDVDHVVVAHAPNHRGFKGTEFLIAAVDQLRSQGLKVKLLLLEKLQNSEVRRILREEADILVEQIIVTGHGLNGLEGMASGLPTISNLEDETYVLPMRRWSFFGECPLISATPENLIDVLRKLVTRPELRKQLGRAGRQYVEKYHGYDSAQYLFTNVIDYVYGRKESFINLYHPLLGEYPNRLPKIQHPLVNNRIAD
jgi:hypothetical protein